MSKSPDCVLRLVESGISINDAQALRRIAMTLHRWHELECGDSNNYASWCITRGRMRTFVPEEGKVVRKFEHDENGSPYIERLAHSENQARYTAIPDRERGALNRLAKILAAYPGLTSYVQGDPRGASLYILPAGETEYTRGIAVYK